MNWKTLIKALLFPHIALLFLLLPLAAILLAGAFMLFSSTPVVPYVAYVLAAYTLTVFCLRIPAVVRRMRAFARENKYIRLWQSDTRLRMNVSLYGALAANTLYGIFQLFLGLYHRTFWFSSLGAYHICLALMRFFLVRHTRKYALGERRRSELVRYRACGWAFLVMNLALSLIVFFMVYWSRTFRHHMITTIAIATYTFAAFTVALLNVIKYRRHHSPLLSASGAISLAAALVSMLTLEATMLTTFGDGSMTEAGRRWLLGTTGGGVLAVIVAMAVFMIVKGTKALNTIRSEKQHELQ